MKGVTLVETVGQHGADAVSLGNLLREARLGRGWSQEITAGKSLGSGRLASRISEFERGKRLPSMSQLLALSDALDLDVSKAILARARAELEEVRERHDDPDDGRLVAAMEQMDELLGGNRRASWDGSTGRTMADFPEAFPNLVIVTGDKREDPPKSVGDLGAFSASPIDDRWIHLLDLPRETTKHSDKVFVRASREELKESFQDRNILIVGSPASNHLARIVNNSAPFRFNLRLELLGELERLLEEARPERDRTTLARHKEKNLDKLKHLMRAFFAYGIVDPIRADVSGFALRDDKDFATITFAQNPYASDPKYVCVCVGGFHLPGTAVGIQFLADKSNFERRPYGGVLEIEISLDTRWENRISTATARWDTDKYQRQDLESGLRRLKESANALLDVSDSDTEACLRLLDAL